MQSETRGAATDDPIDIAFSSGRSSVGAGVCTEGAAVSINIIRAVGADAVV